MGSILNQQAHQPIVQNLLQSRVAHQLYMPGTSLWPHTVPNTPLLDAQHGQIGPSLPTIVPADVCCTLSIRVRSFWQRNRCRPEHECSASNFRSNSCCHPILGALLLVQARYEYTSTTIKLLECMNARRLSCNAHARLSKAQKSMSSWQMRAKIGA